MSDGKSSTIRTRIREAAAQLTASERKIANAILADYPFTGLENIQELAAKTGVSAPSITRFVNKIGCGGFQDLQRQLIAELKEGRRSPLDLKSSQKPVGHSDFLSEYVARVSAVMRLIRGRIDLVELNGRCLEAGIEVARSGGTPSFRLDGAVLCRRQVECALFLGIIDLDQRGGRASLLECFRDHDGDRLVIVLNLHAVSGCSHRNG